MTEGEGRGETARIRRSRPAVIFLALLGVALFALSLSAVIAACSTRGRAFPGLFIDPHGSFSSVWWPAWGPGGPPLRFPDRLRAIDGAPIPPRRAFSDLPAHAVTERVAALAAAGRRQVALAFDTHDGPVTITRPLLRIGADETVFFFGLYALVGAAILWSGLAVFVIARRRAGALSYAAWSVGTFIFMITFFDYHSTARLAPLFALSTVWVQICVLWLAYSFPEPPLRRRRVLKAGVVAFTIAGAAAAAVLMVGPTLGLDLLRLRVVVSHSGFVTMVFLAGVVLFKLRVGSERSRQELASAAWGLAAVPALLAVALAMTLLLGGGAMHLLLPFLAPLLPLSIGYSLIRHNILGTTEVLSRRMFVAPVLTFALAAALIVWLALHAALRTVNIGAAVPWAAGFASMAGLSAVGLRLSGRVFFAATAKFRPTLQQLADDLASKRDVASIGASIQEAVMRWLPTERALVVLPTELHQIPHRPEGFRRHLAEGRAVWTTEAHWDRQLCVPMRSQGGLRGVLVLAPKRETALYTREDLDLLETIASLGAVALHNADVIAELEMLRRFEVGAARDDKRLVLGMLGAEISHEIAYPLNFLRYLLRQGDTGQPLETRDLEVGREEIGRLERMFAVLHKLRIPVSRTEPVLVLPRVRRALDLIRELLQESRITVAVEIPPDLTVLADPDGLVQIFANLLRNAAQAVPAGAAIGARSREAPDGTLALEVWDEGPGVAEELASSIFNPFVTGKDGGSGLGLAVTQRLVRNFGWSIEVRRDGARTVFGIEIPPARPAQVFEQAEL